MRKIAVTVALTVFNITAFACPLSQSLAEHYGISFSGFKVAIPEAKAPEMANGDSLVRVVIPDESRVSDGFRHTVVMNT